MSVQVKDDRTGGDAIANIAGRIDGLDLVTERLKIVFFTQRIGVSNEVTLLAAMSVGARFREFLLPVLLFPLILPVLVFASRVTASILDGLPIERLWWGALGLYDWVVVLVGYFVFDYVLEE